MLTIEEAKTQAPSDTLAHVAEHHPEIVLSMSTSRSYIVTLPSGEKKVRGCVQALVAYSCGLSPGSDIAGGEWLIQRGLAAGLWHPVQGAVYQLCKYRNTFEGCILELQEAGL
jgi:hypothetical protein